MGFPATITLANVASVNHDFSSIRILGSEVERLDLATTLANPTTMLLRHALMKKGSILVDKHNVSFKQIGTDPVTGVKTEGIVNVSFELPRSGVIVVANMQDMWAYARNFLPSAAPAANFTSLLQGMS